MKKILVIFILLTPRLFATEPSILEFSNKPIIDVLATFGDLLGENIISDSTVKGNCSFYFSTKDTREALQVFLKSNNLFIRDDEGVQVVSRIYINLNSDYLVTIITEGSYIQEILKGLSKEFGLTILYDKLPDSTIDINIEHVPLDTALDIIMAKYSDYKVLEEDDFYYIKNIKTTNQTPETPRGPEITKTSSGNYNISISNNRVIDVVKELMRIESKEFSVQGNNNGVINALNYSNKNFNTTLGLILEAGLLDYVYSNNIYYIFDITKTEVENRHSNPSIIHLENITTKDFIRLIPPSFINNNSIKIDDDTNSIIVYGTNSKNLAIRNYIKLIDTDLGRKPYWVKADFCNIELLKNVLLKQFPQNSIVPVDTASFLILVNPVEQEEVVLIQRAIDIPKESYEIILKYIKSEVLIKNLPNSVTPGQILETPNPSRVIYSGTKTGYLEFLKELSIIDKPLPQIKYKVLVLENSLNTGSKWGIDYKTGHNQEASQTNTLPDGEWVSFVGSLGSLLGLNFNVLSALGPLFSFNLEASLNSEKTKVHVDTTLKGISGEKITFRNTKTSRFYSENTSADGKVERIGAAQEVSWGIILDIQGWTSGDGMITVKIQSTISDGNESTGGNSGIPSTSEKIVNTEVRTKEGIPVVIGGLLNTKDIITTTKTPFLGDIPLIGGLFRKEIKSKLNSEFTIYLLPYVQDFKEENTDLILKDIYWENQIK